MNIPMNISSWLYIYILDSDTHNIYIYIINLKEHEYHAIKLVQNHVTKSMKVFSGYDHGYTGWLVVTGT